MVIESILSVLCLIAVVQSIRLCLEEIKTQKLKNAVNKRKNELKYLKSMTTNALAENSSIQEFFPKQLNLLRETVNWNYHSMFRLDEKRQVVIIRFTGYLPEWYMEELGNKVLVKIGDAAIGRAVALKQAVTINTATMDPRFASMKIYSGETGYRSLTCCPVIGRFKTYGGFCAYSKFVNIFTAHDAQFLSTCSNYYGGILEYKLLQAYIQHHSERLLT
jgi:hypothetical protein